MTFFSFFPVFLGLKVAYLSGKYSESTFHEPSGLVDLGVQKRSHFETLVDLAASSDLVDVLLTYPLKFLLFPSLPFFLEKYIS